jgi:proteasome lid subunit RPN8/RPN11
MFEAEAPAVLQITRQMWEQMRQDAARRAPEEACGLLAGRRRGERLEAQLLIIATNLLHSTVRFRLDPQEQLAAFASMDEQNLELVGIYHSHPQGPNGPSPTDLVEAYYPEAAHLIWSGQNGEWTCSAYHIEKGQATPVCIQIVETRA